MKRERSEEMFEKARGLLVGGVNSAARAFQAVEGPPIFMDKGEGGRVTDVDGNEFVDLCCSFGPLILGHAHPKVLEMITTTLQKGTSFGTPTELENELAGTILKHNSFLDKLRFVNSGTEATMTAIRLARGYTQRQKIIKFEGCYHGHGDSLLVKAGSGLATLGTSSSAGVPEKVAEDTIVLPLDDEKAVEEAVKQHKNEIAGLIIEPVPANNGLLIPRREYLETLRSICDKEGIVLIFDEVISGFRLGFEGASGYFDVHPDLVTYGKIIGGGMPVGAIGGKDLIMNRLSPLGDVYQGGTLSGNPVAMAAGLAQVTECTMPGFYDDLREKASGFTERVESHARERNYPFRFHQMGSIVWGAFSEEKRIAKASDIPTDTDQYFKVLHRELLERGVYMPPSGFEVAFISHAHSDDDLDKAGRAFCEALDIVFA